MPIKVRWSILGAGIMTPENELLIPDEEFKEGYRISPTTGIKSYAVDGLEAMFDQAGFKVYKQGYYEFIESFS